MPVTFTVLPNGGCQDSYHRQKHQQQSKLDTADLQQQTCAIAATPP